MPRGLRFFQWVDYFGEDKDQNYEDLLESLNMRNQQVIRREEERKKLEERTKQESDELANKQLGEIASKESEEKAKIDASDTIMVQKRPRPPNLQNKKRRKEEKETPISSHDDRDLSKYYDVYYEAQRSLHAGNIQKTVALCSQLVQQQAYLGLVISLIENILKSYPDNETARSVLVKANIAFNPIKKS